MSRRLEDDLTNKNNDHYASVMNDGGIMQDNNSRIFSADLREVNALL